MPDSSLVSTRKDDHIRINLEKDVTSSITTGLEHIRLLPKALPEMNLADVDVSTSILGKILSAPLLISSMTGGTTEAERINRSLAEAAQTCGVAMGVGSQRAALEDPELEKTFNIREFAPDILLFANIGAVQLNYGFDLDHCRRAVDMIRADALYLHVNAIQEAVQPEGNTRFSGLLNKIESVCRNLNVPVFIKEVGWGISGGDAARLAGVGITGIDVAGAGGTSWSQVEMHRIDDPYQAHIAAAFHGWGIPTARSIRMVREAAPGLTIFASGGLHDGVDAAKCIALGAVLCGFASPILKAAAVSTDETIRLIHALQQEIRICLFACGKTSLKDFQGDQTILQIED
jgi:isopentenyl-diphosphate Delta-isomerase